MHKQNQKSPKNLLRTADSIQPGSTGTADSKLTTNGNITTNGHGSAAAPAKILPAAVQEKVLDKDEIAAGIPNTDIIDDVTVAGAAAAPPDFQPAENQTVSVTTALAAEIDAETQPGPAPAPAPLPSPGKSAAPAVPETSMQRRVFNLAWPVISENFLQTMLGIVDTLMVASLGAAALAGVGSAIQVMFFIIAALSAVSVGSSVLVAQAFGARQLDRAAIFAKQSLILSLLISLPLVLAGLFASGPIISIFMMEPEVTAIGDEYLQVTMGTVGVLTLLLLGGGVLRGLGDSRTPMLITLFANVINVVLTYGLIFGELGMPELGAVGSAWGTFISRLVGLAILLVVMWRGVRGVSIRGAAGWFPRLERARQILKIGLPAASEQILISTAFLTMSIVVAQLGTEALAAHRIAMNAMSISFLPGIGFGLAATALIGQSIGAQRPHEGLAVANISTTWALIWMGMLGIIFFIYAEGIMGLFSSDPTVIALGAAGLRPVALAQPFWAVFFVQSGALRGTGNTAYPMRVNSSSIWISVILGAIGITYLGYGLEAVWGSFLITAPITALMLWRKFRASIQSGKLQAAVS